MRTWTAIGGLAAALGPVVGRPAGDLSWRWIFIVNVPIGVAALMIGWRKLPEVPGHDVPRPDAWGAVLVTAGVAALTFGLVKVNDWGWTSPGVAGRARGRRGAARHLRSALPVALRNPLVEPELFASRAFTGATLVHGAVLDRLRRHAAVAGAVGAGRVGLVGRSRPVSPSRPGRSSCRSPRCWSPAG